MKCPGNHCNGEGEATEEHTCPYGVDINDDEETLCNCCEHVSRNAQMTYEME